LIAVVMLGDDGSTQINPNHSFEAQVVDVVVGAEVGTGGGGVIGGDVEAEVISSLQPKKPGVLHTVVDVGVAEVVGSLQPPKNPGDLQEVVEEVAVGVGEANLLLVDVIVV